MWKGEQSKHIHDIFFKKRSVKWMLIESLVFSYKYAWRDYFKYGFIKTATQVWQELGLSDNAWHWLLQSSCRHLCWNIAALTLAYTAMQRRNILCLTHRPGKEVSAAGFLTLLWRCWLPWPHGKVLSLHISAVVTHKIAVLSYLRDFNIPKSAIY